MKQKIVGYGELLLRLTPSPRGHLIDQAHSLDMSFAGAEANILADLSLLGHRSQFVSALPNNVIGRKAEQFLKKYGLDTEEINWDDNRLGTYYIEHGHSIRATRVTYDRKDSSVCYFDMNENDWGRILQDASYLILTGVTSALSSICHQNLLKGLKSARNLDVQIVFDLNYRRSLWSRAEAKKAFLDILPYINILVGNVGSAMDVFDIQGQRWSGFDELCDATLRSANELQELGDFDTIAMTMRIQNSASQNTLGGMIINDDGVNCSQAINVNVVDRIGGGDAFVAGLIHGMTTDWKPSKIIEFANACYAATHTIEGDINLLGESELLAIAEGEVKGFTKR